MARLNTRKTANILTAIESVLNLLILPLGMVTAGMAIVPLAALMETETVEPLVCLH